VNSLRLASEKTEMEDMFYDRLVKRVEKSNKEISNLLSKEVTDSIKKNLIKGDKATTGLVINIAKREAFLKVLKNAKVFLIDEMVSDSLYNVRHSNINYESSIRLPFPQIFFEFKKPFNFKLDDGSEMEVNGALQCYDYNNPQGILAQGSDKKIPGMLDSLEKNIFLAEFFNKNFSLGDLGNENYSVALRFCVSQLPKFSIDLNKTAYEVDPDKNKIIGTDVKRLINHIELKREDLTDKVNRSFLEDARKKIDLALNLINYINAQNVVVTRKDRETRNLEELSRINARRQRDGKQIIKPLKPYYIIEVKKSYVHEDKQEGGDPEWTLEYRVWVRGHFRHYQDGNRIWIEPYVKGPENAPWKENRYSMLYKNFKHRLARRGNEME
jgi:hypothetical protein